MYARLIAVLILSTETILFNQKVILSILIVLNSKAS